MSGSGNAQYSIRVEYDLTRYDKAVEKLEANIAYYDGLIATLQPGSTERALAELERLGIQKRLDWLNANQPTEPVISAWCADYQPSLTGEVATIEIPDERGTILIRPGDTTHGTADGQMFPAVAQTPEQIFFNLAMLPAVQLRLPGYRSGTITEIDYEAHLCNLDLDLEYSSAQSTPINEVFSLSNVPIQYMICNSHAFSVGDSVVVEFQNRSWSQPRVIGFMNNPQQCGVQYLLIVAKAKHLSGGSFVSMDDCCIVWDVPAGAMATNIPADAGGTPLTFPCLYSDTAYWRSIAAALTTQNLYLATRDVGWPTDPDLWPINTPISLPDYCHDSWHWYDTDDYHQYHSYQWDRLFHDLVPGGTICSFEDITESDPSAFGENWVVGVLYQEYLLADLTTPIGPMGQILGRYGNRWHLGDTGDPGHEICWNSQWTPDEDPPGDYIDIFKVSPKYGGRVIFQVFCRVQDHQRESTVFNPTNSCGGGIHYGDISIQYFYRINLIASAVMKKFDAVNYVGDGGSGETRSPGLESALCDLLIYQAARHGITLTKTDPAWDELAIENVAGQNVWHFDTPDYSFSDFVGYVYE